MQADIQLQEAFLCIQDCWIKIEHQISALRSVWESIDEQLQAHHNSVLHVLQGKIQNAIRKLDSLISIQEEAMSSNKTIAKRGGAKRLKYATYAKASLDSIIDDLRKWQTMFDPSWFFLARISGPFIDHQFTAEKAAESEAVSIVRQMRQAHTVHEKVSVSSASIFLPEALEIMGQELINYSSASTGFISGQRVIVDQIPISNQTPIGAATSNVRDLARVLSKVDPALFGLLCCYGVVKVQDHYAENITRFDLVYPIPHGLGQLDQIAPLSLRSLLSDQNRKYPLDERFHLAASLARSVVFLHSSRIVHKNISPENIIVLRHPSSTLDTLKNTFLVGFERFRFADGRTAMAGDSIWEKNLYRHPGRQGRHPEEIYIMQHDIYSVGVVLLEIGLWTSFVTYPENQSYLGPDPGPELLISDLLDSDDQRKAAAEIKIFLVELARSRLPELMGRIYTDIVITCLTCLDKDNKGFGDQKDFQDEDGISVGVRYIEKVELS